MANTAFRGGGLVPKERERLRIGRKQANLREESGPGVKGIWKRSMPFAAKTLAGRAGGNRGILVGQRRRWFRRTA